VDVRGAVDEGLKDPGVNPVIIPYSLGLYLIANIELLTAAHSSSATSAHISADAFSAGSANTSNGKLSVEPVSLARRSKRLEGVSRQYVVAELFPSISDTEDDDGVEFCFFLFIHYPRMLPI
jgi:hypothetical protein